MTDMDASGLANIFLTLGHHPAAKWLALLLGLRAVLTLVAWRRCPLSHGACLRAPQVRNPRLSAKMRFGAIMASGIALSVWGLLRLAREGAEAPLALLALVLGIYLFTTEPVRRGLDEARNRVVQGLNGPGHADNVAMLRDTHVKLVAVELAIFALFALGMTVA